MDYPDYVEACAKVTDKLQEAEHRRLIKQARARAARKKQSKNRVQSLVGWLHSVLNREQRVGTEEANYILPLPQAPVN